MRILVAALTLVVALAPAATAVSHKPKPKPTPTRYYLSLGASIAAGYLDTTDPVSNQGYADRLFAALGGKKKHLALVRLGCPGETTASMIVGKESLCAAYYKHGSQLADAVAFVKAHQKQMRLVTIELGANDVLGCAPAFDQGCVANGLGAIGKNLPAILAALRRAGGKALQIVGMNYYDPFLATWSSNPAAATAVNQLMVGQFNPLLASEYGAFGARVADVETAFSTTDFTLVAGVPVNVTRICTWTSMCTSGDTNIHPNPDGYAAIASAFKAVVK
jgi:lysophospholipase L1-like esterase